MSKNEAGRFPKLFVTDLDGTALGGAKPYARFPDAFAAFIDRLEQHGCRWVTNTTWVFRSQLDLFEGSSLRSRPAYIIGAMGLELRTMQGREAVSVEPYSSEMAAQLERVRQEALDPFIKDVCTRFEADHMSFNGHWFSFQPRPRHSEAFQAFLVECDFRLNGLQLRWLPEENRLQAYPAFLNKAVAFREIVLREGLRPEEIVIAGDDTPDLRMMDPDLARYAVCPANAMEDVKRRVTSMNGAIGTADYGAGVIEAFGMLARNNSWEWE